VPGTASRGATPRVQEADRRKLQAYSECLQKSRGRTAAVKRCQATVR
jgi:hypothetical protein